MSVENGGRILKYFVINFKSGQARGGGSKRKIKRTVGKIVYLGINWLTGRTGLRRKTGCSLG